MARREIISAFLLWAFTATAVAFTVCGMCDALAWPFLTAAFAVAGTFFAPLLCPHGEAG